MRTQLITTTDIPIERGYLTIAGGSRRQIFQVRDFSVIGRDLSCQLSLHDPFLSLRHARIEARGGGYYLRDLDSRNGTFLNGSRILEARLTDNDRIRMGTTDLVFTAKSPSEVENDALTSLNPLWNEELAKIPSMAQSLYPVLIVGPSGSGKEVLAALIHRLSNRASAPMLTVNCSALTESLAESELFGHAKGSFTGAANDRKGAFETARRGTLFLDEIADLPLTIQPKLLRALENNEIKPVGSDTNVRIDVRIIAATNRDLRKAVAEGRFREDLYFRLHILQLTPPPLRHRLEDFDSLLQTFAAPLKVRFNFQALQKLREYSWPGNIRELKNVVSRAAALMPNRAITAEDIPNLLDRPSSDQNENLEKTTPNLLRRFEKDIILDRLAANRGNQRQTARELGIPKSTLHDRIRTYGIDLDTLKT